LLSRFLLLEELEGIPEEPAAYGFLSAEYGKSVSSGLLLEVSPGGLDDDV
jgi:hypothetical protein